MEEETAEMIGTVLSGLEMTFKVSSVHVKFHVSLKEGKMCLCDILEVFRACLWSEFLSHKFYSRCAFFLSLGGIYIQVHLMEGGGVFSRRDFGE